jgi:simple sugar transport system permease protein
MTAIAASLYRHTAMPGLAALLALAAATLLFWLAGADVPTAFAALILGAFGSVSACLATLTRATPLILTGLSVAVAFRARLWSIGAEGQLFAGAMAAYALMLALPSARSWILVPLLLVAGFAGGAAWGAVAALLKTKRGVDEVMSTVMLNYIILFLLSYLLLSGPWTDPRSAYPQSALVPASAEFPLVIPHSHLHLGFIVALVAAAVIHIVITRTTLGYDVKVLGLNRHAYAAKMGRSDRLILLVMGLSGGLAGLAGTGEVFGLHHRLLAGISPGYGYTGIIIAILARFHPVGIIAGSILFGGLISAAIKLEILTGIPSAASQVIQALLLFAVLIAGAIIRGRHVE